MRMIPMLLVALPLMAQVSGVIFPQSSQTPALTQQYKSEDLGSVAGQLTNLVTGEPVRKGDLQLTPVSTGGGVIVTLADSQGGAPRIYSARSDSSGKFLFEKVAPGKYRLSFNAAGFAGFASSTYSSDGPGHAATFLTLNRAQNVTGLLFRVNPNGVVTGRVVDEDGDPVAYAQVQLLRYRYNQGRRIQTAGATASTNDLGEFRMFDVPAGKYRLSATGVQRYSAAAPQSSPEEYITTYFPSVTDVSAAAELDVAAGAQLQNAVIRLVKARTVHVRGHVTLALQETPAPNVAVSLTSPDSAAGSRGTSMDRQGNFDIAPVVPGAYVLVCNVNRNGKPGYSAQIPVTVGASGVDGLAVTVPAPAELNGTVRAEGADPVAFQGLRVVLSGSVGMGTRNYSATVDQAGAFHLENISPDRYALTVSGALGNRYLKAVRAGGIDALTNGLDLAGGSPGVIDVVLGANAGRITGVTNAAKTGQPIPGALLALIPQEKERRGQSAFYKSATSGSDGRFAFAGIAPGQYKVFAWEQMGDDFNYMDPECIKPVESKGQAIVMHEGDAPDLRVDAIE